MGNTAPRSTRRLCVHTVNAVRVKMYIVEVEFLLNPIFEKKQCYGYVILACVQYMYSTHKFIKFF